MVLADSNDPLCVAKSLDDVNTLKYFPDFLR